MKKLRGELVFKKVSQGIARFEAKVDGVVGNFTLQLDSSIMGDYDPLIHNITGTVELTIDVTKKKK